MRSVKNKMSSKHFEAYHQEYILEEEDSQNNEQEFEEIGAARKRELKRKMKASQLAPLLDRLGRLMIDLAPYVAMLGHTDQSSSALNENLSTYTNEGSLMSKLSEMNKQAHIMHTAEATVAVEEHNEEKPSSSYCSFQIPVMLTPIEVLKLNKLIESEKRNLQNI